jgi:20S proteasome subunit beta 5
MALESICGLNKILGDNLGARRIVCSGTEDGFNEVEEMTANFKDSTRLLMPPAVNIPHLENLKLDYLDPLNHGPKGSNPIQFGHPGLAMPLARQKPAAEGNSTMKLRVDHGTTTLGFKYQGGVLLAVDSRATGGMFIGSQNVKKIIEINKFLLGTMAGGAADCVYWERVLSKQCRLHELRNHERISVAAASKMLANMAYQYKGYGLSMGVMIAGYDKKGPGLYYVDDDGRRAPGNIFSVGSGSTYALGVLDQRYNWDLTDEQAQELGRRAIFQATHRDAASGGVIRVYMVKEDGWVKISEQDMDTLWEKYQEEKVPLDVPMDR